MEHRCKNQNRYNRSINTLDNRKGDNGEYESNATQRNGGGFRVEDEKLQD